MELEIKYNGSKISLYEGKLKVCEFTTGSRETDSRYARHIVKLFSIHDLGVVYLIKYGDHIDSGYIEAFALNENSIKRLVKTDELVPHGKGIIDVNVDFEKGEINYTYKDFDDEIEEGKLYFNKIQIL